MRSSIHIRNASTRAGFTLIELSAVILILGIITVGAMPKMRGLFEQSEMSRISTAFVELLSYAHTRAVLEQQPQVVLVDVREGTYWLQTVDEDRERRRRGRNSRSSRRKQKYVRALNGEFPELYQIEYCYLPLQDDVVRRDEAQLTFYPDGSCDGVQMIVTKYERTNRPGTERFLFIKLNGNTSKVSFMESRDDRQAEDFFNGYWDDEEDERNVG